MERGKEVLQFWNPDSDLVEERGKNKLFYLCRSGVEERHDHSEAATFFFQNPPQLFHAAKSRKDHFEFQLLIGESNRFIFKKTFITWDSCQNKINISNVSLFLL